MVCYITMNILFADIANALGRVVGSFIIFPAIIYGVVCALLRLIKKRPPSRKETIIILAVALGLAILSIASHTSSHY
jgi:Ca2+/Na+ antiporter